MNDKASPKDMEQKCIRHKAHTVKGSTICPWDNILCNCTAEEMQQCNLDR